MLYSDQKCPLHGFSYVSMPRGQELEEVGMEAYIAKCPLAKCEHGIYRSRFEEASHYDSGLGL